MERRAILFLIAGLACFTSGIVVLGQNENTPQTSIGSQLLSDQEIVLTDHAKT
jgi:hypothetical protein